MATVGLIGASGYGGAELLRLADGHPQLTVGPIMAGTQVDRSVAELYPGLAAAYGNRTYEATDPAALEGCDLVFASLPYGESQDLIGDLDKRVGAVVDLAADFRLRDPEAYPRWYGGAHRCPSWLERFVFGLPELSRAELTGARLVAAAGCHVTAAALALAPFTRAGLVEPNGIIVDNATGVSGAGRAPRDNTSFCAVDEDFRAYGLLNHRHTPEIEQTLGAGVLFTPHLAPMNRGILATCYARPVDASLTTSDALDVLAAAYADEPFVVVDEPAPSTKATLGSNTAHLSVRVDDRTGWLVALGALDNLVKGAAGQAIQCANVVLGLEETAGLPRLGVTP